MEQKAELSACFGTAFWRQFIAARHGGRDRDSRDPNNRAPGGNRGFRIRRQSGADTGTGTIGRTRTIGRTGTVGGAGTDHGTGTDAGADTDSAACADTG